MIEKKNKDIYISIYCFYSVYTHILKHFKLGYDFSNRKIGLLAKINVDIIYLGLIQSLYKFTTIKYFIISEGWFNPTYILDYIHFVLIYFIICFLAGV